MSDDRGIERLKWQSRRGLLELDLVFDRFWVNAGRKMTDREQQDMARLLELPDNDLLDLVMGRTDSTDKQLHELVARLRAA